MKNNTTTRLAAVLSLALLAPAHAAMTIISAENDFYFRSASSTGGSQTAGTPFFVPTMGGPWFFNTEAGAPGPFGFSITGGGLGDIGFGDTGAFLSTSSLFSSINDPDPFAVADARAELRVGFSVPDAHQADFSLTGSSNATGSGIVSRYLTLVEDSVTVFSINPAVSTTGTYILQPGKNYVFRTGFITGAANLPGGASFSNALGSMTVTPVPEPSSLMLGALGVLALARRRR